LAPQYVKQEGRLVGHLCDEKLAAAASDGSAMRKKDNKKAVARQDKSGVDSPQPPKLNYW
jgi:hypothetical protein